MFVFKGLFGTHDFINSFFFREIVLYNILQYISYLLQDTLSTTKFNLPTDQQSLEPITFLDSISHTSFIKHQFL